MIPNPFRTQTGARAPDRHELAAALHEVAGQATAPRFPSARVAPSRAQAGGARPDIEALARRLADRRPVDDRGVALTRQLLSDGSGPLYWAKSSDDLRDRVREAMAALEPLAAAVRSA